MCLKCWCVTWKVNDFRLLLVHLCKYIRAFWVIFYARNAIESRFDHFRRINIIFFSDHFLQLDSANRIFTCIKHIFVYKIVKTACGRFTTLVVTAADGIRLRESDTTIRDERKKHFNTDNSTTIYVRPPRAVMTFYIHTRSGQTIECLIRTKPWNSNTLYIHARKYTYNILF